MVIYEVSSIFNNNISAPQPPRELFACRATTSQPMDTLPPIYIQWKVRCFMYSLFISWLLTTKPAIVFFSPFPKCPIILDKQTNPEIDHYSVTVTSGIHVLVKERVSKDVNECVQSLIFPLSPRKDGLPYNITVSAQNAVGTSNDNPFAVAGTCMCIFNVYMLCLITINIYIYLPISLKCYVEMNNTSHR